MIKENSGKFFRFMLDHQFGYGFAEAYDFRDIHPADGTIIFVYNRIDEDINRSYIIEEITSTGIALGPIRLTSFPNTRGIGAWKFLFKHDNFIIEAPNVTKEAKDLTPLIDDWSMLKQWHRSDWDINGLPNYVPYSEVRALETRIMNSTLAIAKKTTMKKLIDDDIKVTYYYNLSEIENRNMYIQLVNTYYPLEKTRELIKYLPKQSLKGPDILHN